MKAAYASLAVLAICFAAFSAYYGNRIGANRPSFDATDEEFHAYRQQQRTDHEIIKLVSVPFFLGACSVMSLALVQGGTVTWKICQAIAIAGALGMGIWTLLLDAAVSFDEVYAAWVIFALLLAVLGAAGSFVAASPRSPT